MDFPSTAAALLMLLIALLPPAALPADSHVSEGAGVPSVLVLGAISDNPRRLQGIMKPMADYVSAKLEPLGIERVEVLIASDFEHMVRLLRNEGVDWITETAYTATLLEARGGAELLLRKWKQGVPDYKSVIFVRRDSPIGTLQHLAGRSIAFQHPGSTTGYYVPASALSSTGFRLKLLGSVREAPPRGDVGYLFSGSEYNTTIWVHKGLVDAGVLSNLDWLEEDYLPPEFTTDFRIIYTSRPIPRAVELVRGNLHPAVKRVLRETLLQAHTDTAAANAMAAYHGTLKFDEFDSESLAMLRHLKALSAETDTRAYEP